MKQLAMMSAAALALVACSEKPGYQINGTVGNAALDGNYVYLYSMDEEAQALDSAKVENGTFTFKGTQDSIVLRKVAFAADVVEPARSEAGEDAPFSAVFALDNSTLQIKLDTLSDVTGSAANDAVQNLKVDLRALRQTQESYIADMKSDDAETKRIAGEKYDAIDEEIADKAAAFILANMGNPENGRLFFDFRYNIPEEKQYEIIDHADEAFLTTPGVNQVAERLEKLKAVAVGKSYIDLELTDVKGKPAKLSDYVGKGKVVLLDFWASWCPPCRRETPKLVEIYKQYKDKGFEIVGVSFDSKQEDWEKGIRDLGITWPQMSDLKGWKTVAAEVYQVNGIPHTILVDKDGTIIARNIHGNKIAEKVAEILGK